MIEMSQADGVRTITLNRPDKANAVTREMLVQIADHVTQAKDTKALILTGKGKVFSAGADLEAARAGLATDPIWEELSGAIAAFPGLSIAALNGTLAGGSMGMGLACDFRLAVPHANFFYPVMKLGFLPQPSDPIRMNQLIGPARTKLMLLAGQKVTAEEALSWGLIDQLIAPDALLDSALKLADQAQNASSDHIAGIKALCNAR